MGGKFQSEFFHGVPSFKDMKRLVASEEGDEIPWSYGDTQPINFFWSGNSRQRMKTEMERLDRLNLEAVENKRWNVTLRWFRNHYHQQCPHQSKQNAALASSLKAVKSEISDPLKSATSEIRGDPLKSATSEIRGRQSRAAPAWDAVAAQESARRSQETG